MKEPLFKEHIFIAHLKIGFVTYSGKKPSLFGFRSRPQDMSCFLVLPYQNDFTQNPLERPFLFRPCYLPAPGGKKFTPRVLGYFESPELISTKRV
jgi:hypothetical protein